MCRIDRAAVCVRYWEMIAYSLGDIFEMTAKQPSSLLTSVYAGVIEYMCVVFVFYWSISPGPMCSLIFNFLLWLDVFYKLSTGLIAC